MADNPNPFIMALGNNRPRTLAEIEAANRAGSRPSLAFRPSVNEATNTEWPSQQQHATYLNNGSSIPIDIDQPRTPRSNRFNPIVISDDEDQENDEAPIRLPKTQRPVKQTHKGKKKRHHTAPDGPASRTRSVLLDTPLPPPKFPFHSKGVKRKVSRADPDQDVFRDIEAESSNHKRTSRNHNPAQDSGLNLDHNSTYNSYRTRARHPKEPITIDLTGGVPSHIWQASQAAERRRRRHRDVDVDVTGTPALDMRRQLRKLATGLPRDDNLGIPGASGGSSRVSEAFTPLDVAFDIAGNAGNAGSNNDNNINSSRPEKRPKRAHAGSGAVESPGRQQRQQPVEEVIADEIVVAVEASPRTRASKRTNTKVNTSVNSPASRRITSAIDAGTTALLQTVQPVFHFFTLAIEIRNKIYRHLLVSSTPIQVQHLWTQVARRAAVRRSRRGAGPSGANTDGVNTTIDNRIMYACRQTADEGARILYSENTFFYLLRDPEVVNMSHYPIDSPSNNARRSSRGRPLYNTHYGLSSGSPSKNTSPRKNGINLSRRHSDRLTINLAKYGPLIRHMAIELEPNRSTEAYERLMAAALESLCPIVPFQEGTLPSSSSSTQPNSPPLHLHTLTLTISPRPENKRVYRGLRSEDGRRTLETQVVLTTAEFFEVGRPVLTALQRLQTDFLRVCLHVNSDVRDGGGVGSLEGDTTEEDDDVYYEDGYGGVGGYGQDDSDDEDGDEGEDEEESDDDDGDEGQDDSDDDDDDDVTNLATALTSTSTRPRYKHLETTLDLRRVAANSVLATATAHAGPTAHLLSNDMLMDEQRKRAGAEAADTLAHLRQHIEQACDFVREPLPQQAGEPATAAQQQQEMKEEDDSPGANSRFMQLLRRLQNDKKTRGIWTEHSVAERKRREAKRREEARFDRDAYADEEEGDIGFRGHRDNGDEIAGAGWESLILSIGQVDGDVRIYRA